MLTDDYRRVVCSLALKRQDSIQGAPQAIVHALWYVNNGRWPTDVTMCGQVESLDVTYLPQNRIVNCADCLKALKKERQFRSREGTSRYQERMREQRDQVETATAGYEGAPELGADMVWVPTEEIDRLLVNTMRMRAVSLRQEGNDDLAADMEITANRLEEHAQIPDDTSVPEAPPAALSENSYTGQERRHRPRMIEPTPGDEL